MVMVVRGRCWNGSCAEALRCRQERWWSSTFRFIKFVGEFPDRGENVPKRGPKELRDEALAGGYEVQPVARVHASAHQPRPAIDALAHRHHGTPHVDAGDPKLGRNL
jgi:hypothetical protein